MTTTPTSHALAVALADLGTVLNAPFDYSPADVVAAARWLVELADAIPPADRETELGRTTRLPGATSQGQRDRELAAHRAAVVAALAADLDAAGGPR